MVRCPKCRCRFRVLPQLAQPEPAGETVRIATLIDASPVVEAAGHDDDHCNKPEGKVSVINILAILLLIDSTLSLIGRLPGLPEVFNTLSALAFHQKAKYLYDTLMAVGFFICAFGLLARKGWARIAAIWLLGLGLAEGLYLLIYHYYAVAELERNLQEGFPGFYKAQPARIVGCLLYGYFIVKLSSNSIKGRFSKFSVPDINGKDF